MLDWDIPWYASFYLFKFERNGIKWINYVLYNLKKKEIMLAFEKMLEKKDEYNKGMKRKKRNGIKEKERNGGEV